MVEKSEAGPATIDEYIKAFPRDIRARLEALRAAIHEAAPEAQEKISYAMPTFFLKGNLVHFAAFKSHIGLYPAPSGIVEFAKELAPYKSAKGSVRLPLDEEPPLELVKKIVRFRAKENLAKAAGKKKR